MDLLYKPPKLLKSLFPKIIWDNPKEGIVLTIDDGPSENTFRILDSLDKHKIKAIFFCTGKNIEKHFNEFNAIIKSGHRVENHGYNHRRLIFSDKKENLKEISKTNELVSQTSGIKARLFRPPYGLFNLGTINAASENRMNIMLWSLLTGDYTGDFAYVRRLTDSYLESNSIIVMHDNRKAAEIFDQSLDFIVKTAKEKKYFFVCF
jgi:peptidoglycan/xylan/chitin deacetylase (PgdA/CDA1 family)